MGWVRRHAPQIAYYMMIAGCLLWLDDQTHGGYGQARMLARRVRAVTARPVEPELSPSEISALHIEARGITAEAAR